MTQETEKNPKYEDMLAELKEIAHKLDEPETTIEEAVSLHKRGLELIKLCEEILEKAELTITEINHPGEQSK